MTTSFSKQTFLKLFNGRHIWNFQFLNFQSQLPPPSPTYLGYTHPSPTYSAYTYPPPPIRLTTFCPAGSSLKDCRFAIVVLTLVHGVSKNREHFDGHTEPEPFAEAFGNEPRHKNSVALTRAFQGSWAASFVVGCRGGSRYVEG